MSYTIERRTEKEIEEEHGFCEEFYNALMRRNKAFVQEVEESCNVWI